MSSRIVRVQVMLGVLIRHAWESCRLCYLLLCVRQSEHVYRSNFVHCLAGNIKRDVVVFKLPALQVGICKALKPPDLLYFFCFRHRCR